jgi:hypothetical protein
VHDQPAPGARRNIPQISRKMQLGEIWISTNRVNRSSPNRKHESRPYRLINQRFGAGFPNRGKLLKLGHFFVRERHRCHYRRRNAIGRSTRIRCLIVSLIRGRCLTASANSWRALSRLLPAVEDADIVGWQCAQKFQRFCTGTLSQVSRARPPCPS